MTEIVERFALTEDHITLISNFYIDWDDSAYDGAPAISVKRPYGNSNVLGDIYKMFHGHSMYEDELSDDEEDQIRAKYMSLHEETKEALQIVLQTKSFVPGIYEKVRYGGEWKLVNDTEKPSTKSGTIDYKIVYVDYYECDATIIINGVNFYFQFPEGKEPTIQDALTFIRSESKFNV